MDSKKLNKIVMDTVKKMYSGDGLYGYVFHLSYINAKKFYISIVYGRETTDGANDFHKQVDFSIDSKEIKNNTYFAGIIYGIMCLQKY